MLVLAALAAHAAGFSCMDGLRCEELRANGMTFSCRFAGDASAAAPVMFLHGFPYFASMWQETQAHLAGSGVHSMACNLRGYSPGARPDGVESYDYDTLRSDVWALADAAGFGKFHLVAHDHGAVLGWTAAATDEGKRRLLSYTAMSVPHLDAFNAALAGGAAEVDVAQQVASQYFSMFPMAGSASRHFGLFFHTLGGFAKDQFSPSFPSAAEFQKALWWYNGAIDAGWMSLPPLWSAWDLLFAHKNPVVAGMRTLYPGSAVAKAHPAGLRARRRLGSIAVPTLYICGRGDTALLCHKPYARRTEEYVEARYTYLEVACGHEVTKEALDCSATEVARVRGAILDMVKPQARPAHDCHAGGSWAPDQAAWCCEAAGVGCPYDCAGPTARWSSQRRDWCCARRGVACPALPQDVTVDPRCPWWWPFNNRHDCAVYSRKAFHALDVQQHVALATHGNTPLPIPDSLRGLLFVGDGPVKVMSFAGCRWVDAENACYVSTYSGAMWSYDHTADGRALQQGLRKAKVAYKVRFHDATRASATVTPTRRHPAVSGFTMKLDAAGGGWVITSSQNGHVRQIVAADGTQTPAFASHYIPAIGSALSWKQFVVV
eukprot:TRINITY_DN2719_c0_g1_i2.p1 TRINITY_DN2719_c0_g1~~TRINITY_DN2719_c0_g1_i2.p1  ORF type:complete len:604 (+),score=176.19 TRINITY_DN2719_c0_g1_i2:48-1859(+)